MSKKSPSPDLSRRQFIGSSCCAAVGLTGMLSTLSSLRLIGAAASPGNGPQTPPKAAAVASDYKALVCLFLNGGNDANNMIVPADTADYAAYAAARSNLALPRTGLLPISPKTSDGRSWALHSSLPEVQKLFGAGKAALLANVGTLAYPTTKAQYRANAVPLPLQLFSHADQQVEWQTSVPDRITGTGWGGRLADLVTAFNTNNQISMSISLSGSNHFQNGVLGITAGPVMPGNITTVTDQLKMVTRLISASSALGLKRQIFFVQLLGWDTHAAQLSNAAPNTGAHANLLAQISAGIDSFYTSMTNLGIADQVTLFTASDFGRTLRSNGDGSDHGWGNHQIVVGGAVKGGDIYGKMPTLVVDGPDDTSQGRWIPTTSVDEYAATLATWFGVSATDLPTVLPNIGRFAKPNLGFL
jgi:uncharacterized protein (DUF1501 family)